MSVPVDLTEAAETDVADAAQWYEQRSSGLGFRFVARVREALGRIGDMPSCIPKCMSGYAAPRFGGFLTGFSTGRLMTASKSWPCSMTGAIRLLGRVDVDQQSECPQ